MKIVLLERNSAGTDVPVDCFNELGEVTSYPNTVTAQEVAERVGDAENSEESASKGLYWFRRGL